jgi:pimeloyl-ACP methyl ester carboxylesterase
MRRRDFFAVSVVALSGCASASREIPAQTNFASTRIQIQTRGRGPDIVLVHGLNSSTEIWRTTVSALETRYRLHLVQINGFAGHPANGNLEGPVVSSVAEEIARYVSEAQLERPAVIGHSLGGTVGMMLAARHPTLVGRLMVVDMIPFMGLTFGDPNATAETLMPMANRIRDGWAAAPNGVLAPQTVQMINAMVRTESARAQILEHARTSDNRVSANAFHELIVTDLRPELLSITQPLTVLYVYPPNVPISAETYDTYMIASYANAPQARIIKIEDSYHFIMIDQFERFIDEVDEFLRAS